MFTKAAELFTLDLFDVRQILTLVVLQIAALKNLGLNIKRAKLEAPDEANRGNNKFYVTDVAKDEKIMSSAKLEEIRLTILNIMISYHPEAAESLNIGTK